MGTKVEVLPFKEYSSTLKRYSNSNQLQSHQYKDIIESEMGQAVYQRAFPTFGEAALGPLNANVPVYNQQYNVKIEDKNVNVYKQFWQYKQNGGTIFTDWNSAGVSNIKQDLSVKDLPLYRNPNLQDSTLILSNTNNVRNNLQNYGKEYLTTTNMLNAEAFSNGVSYETGGSSPKRTSTNNELQRIIHGNFGNKEDGDLYSRQIKQLRVDLPANYANNNLSSWQYINPAFIIPNRSLKVFHEKLKYGIFDLESMKYVGDSCLTKNYNFIPQGFDNPIDVYNDKDEYPPLSNINYYNNNSSQYMNSNQNPYASNAPAGTNLYCSANTNYVAMPRNHSPNTKDLDTSIQVSPGNNSLTLGTVMSPRLKEFINKELFEFNKMIVLICLYNQNFTDPKFMDLKRQIAFNYPNIFRKKINGKTLYEDYTQLTNESSKYQWTFNKQRNFSAIHQINPEVEHFINHLSIFKFGGNNLNNPGINGLVRLRELHPDDIPVEDPGIFLLLPTMMSEDLFEVRENVDKTFAAPGIESEINNNNNSCITPGASYDLNMANCCFRGKANEWQQSKNVPNFVPNMFNDANNYNNDIYNLINPGCGTNPYDAPNTF